MKKTIAFFCIIVGLATVLVVSGCSGSEAFVAGEYSSGENRIDGIVIDVSDREVKVGVSDDDQIHIEYYESESETYDISVSEDNELTMKLILDKEWTDFIGVKAPVEYRTIKLEIPSHLLSDLTVKTTNGTIKVSDLPTLESITLDSNGGNVEFEKIAVEESLDVTAKNGNISGTIIGGWDDFSISCDIKKGESNLPESKTGGEKSLTANCNNGDIYITFMAE